MYIIILHRGHVEALSARESGRASLVAETPHYVPPPKVRGGGDILVSEQIPLVSALALALASASASASV